jgi:hypothetical protein
MKIPWKWEIMALYYYVYKKQQRKQYKGDRTMNYIIAHHFSTG